jgi:D-lactate dehydrogenase
LKELLLTILPENRIRTRYIDLVSFASDAGFYYLLPRAVVQPLNEQEIVALMGFARQHHVPLVFRTGGTSLSGQSVTDGILVDLSQYWNKVSVEGHGDVVRVQPGITGAMVNAHLKKHRRKIGPDPSSISSAMMGGILSNNSSGMCCGVNLNSYHTTKFIRFILPDGKMFSTENAGDYQRFETECSALAESLVSIRREIHDDPELYRKIRTKYRTKTTVGYSLNAFVDYQHPLDILARLLIGAEGTLAFIAEAVLQTVPDYPFKATALLYFPDIYAACQAIVPLTNAGALMVELMDRAALRAVEDMVGMPPVVRTLPESAAALLIEFQENSMDALEERVNRFLSGADHLAMINQPVFTYDPREQDFFWKVRKGLFPSVGAVRASGTTVILEDVAFPVENLGDAILDLQVLFRKYNYDNAIIFGHAKDGNIHFVVTQSFNSEQEIIRYDTFIREVVELVVHKYNGTLKAEHGTGRNMAPFVETEWGGKAYQIIRRIKYAVDPELLLNPGVIVNDDANVHIRNLKDMPTVEEEVDRCIECGYCEHKCPSRDITTTPRRRIVVRRVLRKLELAGHREQYDLLLNQYQYDGIDTCAVDGLCATACPVDINTGDLVKRLRRENHSKFQNRVALWVAQNFGVIVKAARLALSGGVMLNTWFGANTMLRLTKGLKRVIPAMPLWSNNFRRPPVMKMIRQANTRDVHQSTRVVYFPSCISRIMGTYPGKDKNILETFLSVCHKATIGVDVVAAPGNCCGQIFSSKGYADAFRHTANDIVARLWVSSDSGVLPVVTDVSSCAYTLHQLHPVLNPENRSRLDRMVIMDIVDFIHDLVMPVVEVKNKHLNIVLHPVCSLDKMKTVDKFTRIGKYFAREVTVPKTAGCCGMAGDRGFFYPELTSSASAPEASEVKGNQYDAYYSSTRTCEIAMTEASGRNYESILYLVDDTVQ